jgi:hypothetical protein
MSKALVNIVAGAALLTADLYLLCAYKLDSGCSETIKANGDDTSMPTSNLAETTKALELENAERKKVVIVEEEQTLFPMGYVQTNENYFPQFGSLN